MLASGRLCSGFLNGTAIAGFALMTPFIITLGHSGRGARDSPKWLADNQTVNYDTSVINGWMTTAKPFGYALPPGVWVAAVPGGRHLDHPRASTVFGRHVFAAWARERGDGAALRHSDAPDLTIPDLCGRRGRFLGWPDFSSFPDCGREISTVAVGLELDIIAAAVIIGGASLSGVGGKRHSAP